MVKKNVLILVLAFLLVVSLANAVLADVGVGISPTKIVLNMESGKSQQVDFLMFNSGDSPLNVNVNLEGDIAKIGTVSGVSGNDVIQPEPLPHQLPIKNGKTFSVTFSPSMAFFEKKYSGTISVSGSPVDGSQFGGSVGVAAQADITVTPSASSKAVLYGAIVLVVIIAFLCWKKYKSSGKKGK